MEVVVIESKTFQTLTQTINSAVEKIESVMAENLRLKEDRWLSVDEAAKYIGFSKQWLLRRKVEFGVFQEGQAVKFKRSSLDAYMEKYRLISNRRKAS
ncbi:helix-turn-helix domain-containing protein [Pedobacter faecalis]|uniref:helix-turn-helix domain-containing protein n=1 Tax=Pedobacter faecalis TaxID=3041495 RepID=UPI00254E2D01|nr:helix-turn-helix domain-containing protein [Pedobacter sp. ELA7]